MSKRTVVIGLIAGIVFVFLAAGIYAGTEVKDVFDLKDPVYKEHKKGIVKFTHKKHAEDYAQKFPEFYNGNPVSRPASSPGRMPAANRWTRRFSGRRRAHSTRKAA